MAKQPAHTSRRPAPNLQDTDPLQHAVVCSKRFLRPDQIRRLENLIDLHRASLFKLTPGSFIRLPVKFGQSYLQNRMTQMGLPISVELRARFPSSPHLEFHPR